MQDYQWGKAAALFKASLCYHAAAFSDIMLQVTARKTTTWLLLSELTTNCTPTFMFAELSYILYQVSTISDK